MGGALRGGSQLAEEFLILVAELGAHVVKLASGHGRLQYGGHRPCMLGGLVLAYALFLCNPAVEVVYPEGVLVPGALYVGGYLRRELGGQVGRLVARQALPQRLEGRAGSLLCVLVVAELREFSNLGDKLIALHRQPLSFARAQVTRVTHRVNGSASG